MSGMYATAFFDCELKVASCVIEVLESRLKKVEGMNEVSGCLKFIPFLDVFKPHHCAKVL